MTASKLEITLLSIEANIRQPFTKRWPALRFMLVRYLLHSWRSQIFPVLGVGIGVYFFTVVLSVMGGFVFNLKADDVSSFQITICGIGRHGVIRDTSEALINQGVSIQIDVDGCPFKEVFSIEHAKGRWKKVGITISNDEVDIQTSKIFPSNNENSQKRAFI